jgi:replicative DNA helicase
MIQTKESFDRRDIEANVLGSMALMGEAAEFVNATLSGDEFVVPEYRLIFASMRRLLEIGVPCDAVIIAEDLQSRDELQAAGGVLSIQEILETVSHAAHVRFYVKQLQALHQRDELKQLADDLRFRADDMSHKPSDIVSDAITALEVLMAARAIR